MNRRLVTDLLEHAALCVQLAQEHARTGDAVMANARCAKAARLLAEVTAVLADPVPGHHNPTERTI